MFIIDRNQSNVQGAVEKLLALEKQTRQVCNPTAAATARMLN